MKKIPIVFLVFLAGCGFYKTMDDVRAAEPVFSAVTEMSVIQFTSCFMLYIEEEVGPNPVMYSLRVFEDRTEIISQSNIGPISFVLIASPVPDGTAITLREGFGLEIDDAIQAIRACGGTA